MKNFFIERKFIRNSNGAYKYGFLNELRKKHYLPSFFLPLNDWEHGWNFFESEILDCYKVNLSHKIGLIVPNEKIQDSYRRFTSNEVILDSLPFYYFFKKIFRDYKNKTLGKSENNLLVFPGKMPFAGENKDELSSRLKYFEFIKSLEKDFEHIFVCIPYSDLLNEDYKELIEKMNLTYFTGADPADANSYYRLLEILSLAKFVTTNVLGSILIYAGILNKKISISGPFYKRNRNFKYLTLPRNFKYSVSQIKDEYKRIESEEFMITKFKDLIFTNPILSKEKFNWASKEIGAKNFVSSKKACENLGLSYKRQFEKLYNNILWKK